MAGETIGNGIAIEARGEMVVDETTENDLVATETCLTTEEVAATEVVGRIGTNSLRKLEEGGIALHLEKENPHQI